MTADDRPVKDERAADYAWNAFATALIDKGFMRTLGAVLESVESGMVTITCGFDEGLTQQNGLARMTATMMAVDATSA